MTRLSICHFLHWFLSKYLYLDIIHCHCWPVARVFSCSVSYPVMSHQCCYAREKNIFNWSWIWITLRTTLFNTLVTWPPWEPAAPLMQRCVAVGHIWHSHITGYYRVAMTLKWLKRLTKFMIPLTKINSVSHKAKNRKDSIIKIWEQFGEHVRNALKRRSSFWNLS